MIVRLLKIFYLINITLVAENLKILTVFRNTVKVKNRKIKILIIQKFFKNT